MNLVNKTSKPPTACRACQGFLKMADLKTTDYRMENYVPKTNFHLCVCEL